MTEERKDEERKVEEETNEAAEAEAEGQEGEQDDAEQSDDERPARSQTKLWIAIGIGVAIAVLLVMKRGGSDEAGVGSTTQGDLTLVNADRNELDCATDKGVESYQCGFADENQARTVEEAKKLRPYMTVDRHLYLIPGLFLEPAIGQRYNSEPADKPRADQKRFTAKCKIKVVGELNNVKLRWSPTGTWEPPKKFPVATVSDCAIEG